MPRRKNLISSFAQEACLVRHIQYTPEIASYIFVSAVSDNLSLYDSGLIHNSCYLGAEHMRDSKSLVSILKKQKAAGKRYAAVCAAPAVVLAFNG
jgi:hypothetical protein